MKKLSAVQLKQQALVFSVADSLEAQALEELNGMQQCWFDVQYHQFPGSLLLRFQFENEEAVSNAEPELKKWQRKLSAALLKKRRCVKRYAQASRIYHTRPRSVALFNFAVQYLSILHAVLPGKCLVIILSFFGIKSTYTLSGK